MKKKLVELLTGVKHFFARERVLLVAGALGICAFWSLAGWLLHEYAEFSLTPVLVALGILYVLAGFAVYFFWPFTDEDPDQGEEEKIAA